MTIMYCHAQWSPGNVGRNVNDVLAEMKPVAKSIFSAKNDLLPCDDVYELAICVRLQSGIQYIYIHRDTGIIVATMFHFKPESYYNTAKTLIEYYTNSDEAKVLCITEECDIFTVGNVYGFNLKDEMTIVYMYSSYVQYFRT